MVEYNALDFSSFYAAQGLGFLNAVLADNPFVDFGAGAIDTPRIAGLAGGAEAFGLLTMDAATLLGEGVFAGAPDGAGLAVIRASYNFV